MTVVQINKISYVFKYLVFIPIKIKADFSIFFLLKYVFSNYV